MYWLGKTTTLVEAIKQIVRTQPSSYILACTPSNSATDHLCEKLLEEKIDNCNVYRMYSTSWPEKRIPQNIKVWICLYSVPRKYTIHIISLKKPQIFG